MGQKSNLLTLRKKGFLNLTTYNSKAWGSVFSFVQLFIRLFFLKDVYVTHNCFGFDNNIVSITFFLFYQVARFKKFKKKLKRSKLNSIKKFRINNLLILLTNFFNFNSYVLRFISLNKLKNVRIIKILYENLKNFEESIFSRRIRLFIDFLRITYLFIINKIKLEFYIKILGRIFKFLSKKLHGLYVFFIKSLFSLILNLSARIKNIKRVTGLYLRLSGRIRGKHRSSSKFIKRGIVSNFSMVKDITFVTSHVYTLYGVFGLKVWISRLT